ncbi:MAG: ABC transporter permease, partial [Minicystis sp.]
MILLSRILSSVMIALRMVVRNKLRAALTVIGITIGIAAVVTMIALGKGARTSVSNSVQSLGSNALMVFPNSSRTSGAKNNLVGIRLSELDCEALSRGGSSIRLAAPFMRASAQVIYEGQNTKTSVIGSRLSYFDVRNLKVTRGEMWTPSGEATNEKVVLIGQTTRK